MYDVEKKFDLAVLTNELYKHLILDENKLTSFNVAYETKVQTL